MQSSKRFKALCLAGVALALLATGGGSVSATTTALADTTTQKADSNLANEIATYGDVKKTLVKLAGTKNTRDFGGYKTADGKWQIRPNRLLRSDNLHYITNNDKSILAADHHVTSIIDFRTDGQITGAPDQQLAGVSNTSMSVLGSHAFSDSVALSPTFAGDGGFYVQQLEFSQSAINSYSRFLNMLLHNRYATLYHCTSGKDRTGIATVLVMTILGMDKDTILGDFMQSHQTGRLVKKEWLDEYYREITSRYVTLNRYITNVLGFSRLQQTKLRSMYLVSTDGKNTPYTATAAGDTTFATKPKPTTPTPAPTPAPQPSQPQPSQPQQPASDQTQPTTPDVAVPAEGSLADQPVKTKPAKHQIISTKKHHTKYLYHLKGHKQWFKDARLQKSKGRTAKHQTKTWRLVKSERIKINGKMHTYYQVQDHAGHKAWILKSYVVKVK
ncbi:tyrosine-protein phosphatase [Levilactobacillus suantsaiihabitans]|uniref:Tyrosine-protein phosphatase n=1 Tax=Levilactobacillus suantsaiihabitans TaxID=2487722 RepID=A0A4Z0J6D3_9LACO|nr:tyrosine-protein phosphatase [Levilactobacillus suantsaiihabitans]TGD18037.1 tyrosine-protein phosphatase [Levilactobacillus suantsaiihabitans]